MSSVHFCEETGDKIGQTCTLSHQTCTLDTQTCILCFAIATLKHSFLLCVERC